MLCGILMAICSENHTKTHEYNLGERYRDFLRLNREATYNNNWYALKVNTKTDPSRGFNTNRHYSSRLSLIVSHILQDTRTVSSPYPKATCSLASNLLPVTMKTEKKLLVAFNFPKLTLLWLEITPKVLRSNPNQDTRHHDWGISQALQTNSETVLPLRHDRILPNPFHFIIEQSMFRWTLRVLWYGHVVT
jgi:hypothetical protein